MREITIPPLKIFFTLDILLWAKEKTLNEKKKYIARQIMMKNHQKNGFTHSTCQREKNKRIIVHNSTLSTI